MKKKNLFKELLKIVYFFVIFIAIADALIHIEKLILFDMRPETIYAGTIGFFKLPLLITLTFCTHIAIKKLYKRFFEKTKISFNKTQHSVLISCLVLSVALSVYSLSANKTEVNSDGKIKEYDYLGRVSSVKTVDETEKVELKTEKIYSVTRYSSNTYCGIVFSLFFQNGEIFEFEDSGFRNVEAMKAIKNLAGDKLVIIHSIEEAWEIIGIADSELYMTYSELLSCEGNEENNEDNEDNRYHSYYETYEGTTYYDFGMDGHMIYE